MREIKPTAPPTLSALLQGFFAEYMMQQKALSPCTVAAYRDTFMLFLNFVRIPGHRGHPFRLIVGSDSD